MIPDTDVATVHLWRSAIMLTFLALSGGSDVWGQVHRQELANARALCDKLRRLPVPSLVANVTEEAQSSARELKADIRAWVVSRVSKSRAVIDPSDFRRSLLGELGAAGLLRQRESKASHTPGLILDVFVSSSPADHILKVAIAYDSYCPPDDSVLLFERNSDNGWQLALNFDSELTYPTGDRDLMFAGLSPHGNGERSYALVVMGRSICAGSGGQDSMEYYVLLPGGNPSSPQVVLDGGQGLRDSTDLRIAQAKNTLTLEFSGWSWTASLSRTHILTYSIDGDRVRRIQPVAPSAEGFVEECFHSPWQQAQEWSARDGKPGLREWHERLAQGSRLDPAGSRGDLAEVFRDSGPLSNCVPREFWRPRPRAGRRILHGEARSAACVHVYECGDGFEGGLFEAGTGRISK